MSLGNLILVSKNIEHDQQYSEVFTSIQEAIDFAGAGDIIQVDSGSYEPFRVTKSGLVDKPIKIESVSGKADVLIDGIHTDEKALVTISGQNHVYISGLQLVNAPNFGIYVEGSSQINRGITIENNLIDTTGSSGIHVNGIDMSGLTEIDKFYLEDVIIRNNEVTNTNTPNGVNEAISIGGGVDGFIVERNHVHNTEQYGIDVKAGAKNGIVSENIIHDVEFHGIYIDAGSRTISNVLVEGNKISNASNGIVVAREARRDPENPNIYNIDVLRNEISDVDEFGVLLYRHVDDSGSGVIQGVGIHSNVIEGAGLDGIRVANVDEFSNEISITDNAISNSGRAIWENSGATVRDNFTGSLEVKQVSSTIKSDLWKLDGDDRLTGTAADDVIWGISGNDTLVGLDGEDTLNAGQGDDLILAGFGDDYVVAADGQDTVRGGDGNDTIRGYAGDDLVWGEAGSDMIVLGDGDDVAVGGEGDDTIEGGFGFDTLWGSNGEDSIAGNQGNDLLGGGNGNDTIAGGQGSDELSGDFGDDVLYGGEGNDTIRGGADTDIIYGGSDNDVLHGGSGSDVVFGQDGDDILKGGVGGDLLWGGQGADIISGGSGGDQISGGEDSDILRGEDGDDKITGNEGNDFIYGGEGADILRGELGDDLIFGGKGSDRIFDSAGQNTIYGGDGDDFIFSNGNGGVISGGQGDDSIQFGKGQGSETVLFGSGYGSDTIFGFSDNDIVQFSSDLWNGPHSVETFLDAFATTTSEAVLFSFAGGEQLTILGATDIHSLYNQIDFL